MSKTITLANLKEIQSYQQKNSVSVPLIDSSLLGSESWEQYYKDNQESIDLVAYRLFDKSVLEYVYTPTELTDLDTLKNQLKTNAQAFLMTYKNSINRLWVLESVNFSPIENYDRIEESTLIKSGNEISTNTKTGSKSNNNTSNGSVTNTIKNNQSIIDTNEPTAYNTNVVEKNKTSYEGEADTSTTTYNGLSNNSTETYNNIVDDNTHIYNDVTDKTESRIHGNIGVTTATAMMKEYVDFYSTYNFWKKFWELYLSVNGRADYDNNIL